MFDFTGKVVLVTGGSGNLGGATVTAFAAAGATLVVPDRKAGRLATLFPDLANDAHFLADNADIATPDGAGQLVDAVVALFGRIDVLINTAGGYRAGKPVHETDVDTWDFMLSLNARTVYVLSQAVVPVMIAGGGGGAIVSTAARSALHARGKDAAYAASKAALARLTESLAAENKQHHITANAILPGTIDTPENRAAMPRADFSTWTPPEAIAQVFMFLASDAGRVINGALIPVWGYQ